MHGAILIAWELRFRDHITLQGCCWQVTCFMGFIFFLAEVRRAAPPGLSPFCCPAPYVCSIMTWHSYFLEFARKRE